MTAQQIKSQNNTMRDRKINKPLNRRQNYKNSVPCACAMRTAVRIRRSARTRILSADEHTTQEITHFSHCLHVLIQQTCLHQHYITHFSTSLNETARFSFTQSLLKRECSIPNVQRVN